MSKSSQTSTTSFWERWSLPNPTYNTGSQVATRTSAAVQKKLLELQKQLVRRQKELSRTLVEMQEAAPHPRATTLQTDAEVREFARLTVKLSETRDTIVRLQEGITVTKSLLVD